MSRTKIEIVQEILDNMFGKLSTLNLEKKFAKIKRLSVAELGRFQYQDIIDIESGKISVKVLLSQCYLAYLTYQNLENIYHKYYALRWLSLLWFKYNEGKLTLLNIMASKEKAKVPKRDAQKRLLIEIQGEFWTEYIQSINLSSAKLIDAGNHWIHTINRVSSEKNMHFL